MDQATSPQTEDAGARTSRLPAKLVGGLVWSVVSIAVFTPWSGTPRAKCKAGATRLRRTDWDATSMVHSPIGFLSSQGSAASPLGGPS